jgi:hypothetical protein
MKKQFTLYVVDAENKLVGEVKYHNFPTFIHLVRFKEEIAKSYGVIIDRVLSQPAYEKILAKKGIYLCTICHDNTVNPQNGIDTCDDCIKNI